LIVIAAILVAIVIVVERMTKGTTARNRSGSFFAFANAIASAEGFGVPGAIPTVRNNPGDLKLPSSGGAITTFATPADGWEALYKQLDLIRSGSSSFYDPDMSVAQVAGVWTATQQSEWLTNVLASMARQGYNVGPGTPIGVVLT
jgi:hypothetical protein